MRNIYSTNYNEITGYMREWYSSSENTPRIKTANDVLEKAKNPKNFRLCVKEKCIFTAPFALYKNKTYLHKDGAIVSIKELKEFLTPFFKGIPKLIVAIEAGTKQTIDLTAKSLQLPLENIV